jgi:hypothetical protein
MYIFRKLARVTFGRGGGDVESSYARGWTEYARNSWKGHGLIRAGDEAERHVNDSNCRIRGTLMFLGSVVLVLEFRIA